MKCKHEHTGYDDYSDSYRCFECDAVVGHNCQQCDNGLVKESETKNE